MIKYIKLEDAEDKMYQLWEEDTDNKINSAYCFDDDRAIEALRSLPTIEVSEDCISREYLKSFAYINKGDFNSVETIREWIDNAPSVVPTVRVFRTTAEPQKIGYCNECKWFRDKQVCGRCRSKNLYAPKDEPQGVTTEQSSKVGEWENYKDEHRCSGCGEVV